jgi:hypothetical protein
MSDPGASSSEAHAPDPALDAEFPAYEQPYAASCQPQSPYSTGPAPSSSPPFGYQQTHQQLLPPSGNRYLPGYWPVPPPRRPPRPSPFAGLSRVDAAHDAAAIAALIATLLLPWTAAGRGYSRPEVIAAVALGICAITMSYLSRMGLFGRSWTPAKLRAAKLMASAPLALCAATYFVIDAVLGTIDIGVTEYAPAPGAWIGAAAAALAAVPRRADLIDATTQRSDRLWAAVLSACCAALIVFTALALVLVTVATYRSLSTVYEMRALVVMPAIQTLLFGAWVVAVWRTARHAARGVFAGRLALGAVGAGALVWAMCGAMGRFTLGGAESLHLPFGGFTLTMVAALVALSPSLNPQGRHRDPRTWLGAVRSVLGLVIVADILLLVQVVVDVTLTGALTAVVYTCAGCAGIGAIATDWARQQVTIDPFRSRTPVLIAAAVQMSAGVASILVTGLSTSSWETVTGPQVIAALALPVSAAAFVTLPAEMHAFFPAPVPLQPFPPSGWPLHAIHSYPASVAADPSTPAAVLYGLAQQNTAVWPSLAANPAAPHDLLALLAQSVDPAVQAALRARRS